MATAHTSFFARWMNPPDSNVDRQEVVLATLDLHAVAGEEEESGVAFLDGVGIFVEGAAAGGAVEVDTEFYLKAEVAEGGGEVGGVVGGVEGGLAEAVFVADDEGAALGRGEVEATAGLSGQRGDGEGCQKEWQEALAL